LRIFESLFASSIESFNPPEYNKLIVLKNCVLNVQTKERLEFNPKYLATTRIPIDFAPEADCPEFKKFLNLILLPEDIVVVWELFGVALLRYCPYDKMFWFLGQGGNGKGTLLQVLERLLGSENVSGTSISRLGNPDDKFASSDLFGKLANIDGDASDAEVEDTEIIKKASGGDKITAQFKGQDSFDFHNFATLVFAANKMPVVEDTRAWNRRQIYLEFKNVFEEGKEEDREVVLNRIANPAELSGILNHALIGLDRLFKQKGFSFYKSYSEIGKEMRNRANTLDSFMESDLVEIEPGFKVSNADVYAAYSQFCINLSVAPVSIKSKKDWLSSRIHKQEFPGIFTGWVGKAKGFIGFGLTEKGKLFAEKWAKATERRTTSSRSKTSESTKEYNHENSSVAKSEEASSNKTDTKPTSSDKNDVGKTDDVVQNSPLEPTSSTSSTSYYNRYKDSVLPNNATHNTQIITPGQNGFEHDVDVGDVRGYVNKLIKHRLIDSLDLLDKSKLVSFVLERCKVSEKEVEDCINSLLDSGDIRQPVSGKFTIAKGKQVERGE